MRTNRKVVRLTESKLRRMIAEAVDETLNEYGETDYGQYMLGRLAYRKSKTNYGGPIYNYARAARGRNNIYADMVPFQDGYRDQSESQEIADGVKEGYFDDSDIINHREYIKRNAQMYRDRTPWVRKN